MTTYFIPRSGDQNAVIWEIKASSKKEALDAFKKQVWETDNAPDYRKDSTILKSMYTK